MRHPANATSEKTANLSKKARFSLLAATAVITTTTRRSPSTPAASPTMPLSSIDTQLAATERPPGNATATATTGNVANAAASSSSAVSPMRAVARISRATAI